MKFSTLLTFIFLFLIGSIAFSQTEEWNQTNEKGEKVGQWRDFYKNANLRYTGQFKNGKPFGEFENYYEDGKLQAILTYITPEKAYAELYYQTGEILAKGYYFNQQRDSVWTTYGAKGRVVSKGGYLGGKKF